MNGFDTYQWIAAIFVVVIVNGCLLSFAYYHYKQLKKLREEKTEDEERYKRKEQLYVDLEL